MTQTPFFFHCARLIVTFSFVLVVFLATASSVFACSYSCVGTYHPAGTDGARSITGRNDTGVCVGTIESSGCSQGVDEDGGGGGVGGGGGGGGGADLTMSNTNPTIATAGQSVTYSATVYNGSELAGQSQTIFQIASETNYSDSQVIGTVATDPMQPYASRTVSLPYTHTGSSFYMRACADSANGVPETNEGNNCGAWTVVTVYQSVTGGSCTSQNTWHTGPSTQVFAEWVQNGGGLGSICEQQASGNGYTYWNESIEYTNRPGDAGSPIARVVCAGLSSPTGTVAKPMINSGLPPQSETSYRSGGCVPQAVPDLAPISLVPTTVVAGTPALFTATLRNAGGVATPNFSSTIYICQSSDSACLSNSMAKKNESFIDSLAAFFAPIAQAATSIKVALTGSAIPAISNGTQTGTQTLGSPGNYSMRLCADLPANQVAETNENDNCGTWQLLSVCPSGNTVAGDGSCVPQPPTTSCSISANPTQVITGAATTLTWSSAGATSCTGVGFSTGGSTSGSASVTPAGNSSYSVTCNGGAGTCNATPVTVTTGGTCPGTPTADIQATPSRVRSGQSTTLTWNAAAISGTCTISGPGVSQTVSSASCAVPSSTVSTPTLTSQSTYTISCDGGAALDTVIVNMIPGVVEF